MTVNYKYGFTYKGFSFGWKDKKLFRLPSFKNLKSYPLKEVPPIKMGTKKKPKTGYRVVRDRKTIDQLMLLTEIINYKYVVNGKNSKDTPF